MEKERGQQPQDLIFALDIGTRSIIGVVGRAEGERFRVLAIEKQEHGKRSMLDGQIEDISQVAKVISTVVQRLEERLDCALTRVCIAAAGRALHTERGRFQIALPGVRRVDDDLIGQLEAGAVAQAEGALQSARSEERGRFFLVGYTVSQYLLDNYPLSTLRDHNGQTLEAEVVATFLPGEVVESLYSAMHLVGLEVVSLTLEPIAALNAAIPAELRLLNLVLVDIGAGTSDVAVCRDGAVVGYTMATVAGDEITEAIMRALLVDFRTAEGLKAGLGEGRPLTYTDILGLEQQVQPEQLNQQIMPQTTALAQELARCILSVNGDAPPSALFLAGGGSKLDGLRELVAQALDMDTRRVAVAGRNFQITAFSDVCQLDDPEYATPLGIAVSAGLGLINDSYRVKLNDQPAKLFRSGTLTALDVLMMNGYVYADLIGRTGQSLSIIIDGERAVYRGEPAVPCVLRVNDAPATPSTVIQTGDDIRFIPAKPGQSAQRTLEQVLGSEGEAMRAVVNGQPVEPDYALTTGDIVLTRSRILHVPTADETVAPPPEVMPDAPPAPGPDRCFLLNGAPLTLPAKADGAPHYLMDLLIHSGLDLEDLRGQVVLQVNGEPGQFARELKDGDDIVIRDET